MLEEAQEALRAIGDDTARFAFQRNQIVTVAAVPTATRSLLPRAIQAFRDQGFDGRIRINDLSANDVLEAVASGAADFGVNFIGGQEPGLDFRVLADDPFVLAVPRGGELDVDRPVEWADVDPSGFIAVWKGSGNRMLIDSALAHARENVGWAYEVRHLSTALGLVEAGLGVTAVPASAMPGPGTSAAPFAAAHQPCRDTHCGRSASRWCPTFTGGGGVLWNCHCRRVRALICSPHGWPRTQASRRTAAHPALELSDASCTSP